jgi:hypothetical protein
MYIITIAKKISEFTNCLTLNNRGRAFAICRKNSAK